MDALLNLHFIRPLWLWALLPALLLFLLLWRNTRTHRGWSEIIDPDLLPHLLVSGHSEQRSSPVRAVLFGWMLAVIGLAGPSWEKIPQPVQQKDDALVILLDLSPSMLAQDLKPSRLERARRKLRDLMNQRSEGTTALIAYAGDAHIVSPLTDDVRTIANLIPALSPGIMPSAGSNVTAAANMAIELFRAAGQLSGRILLLTDGIREDRIEALEDLLSGSPYTLSIIGIGTSEGSPIPTLGGQLQTDSSGAIVLARLESKPLDALAGTLGGGYQDIALDDSDLSALIGSEDLSLAASGVDALDSESALRSTDSWLDQGYWLALACLPLALAAFRRGWVLCLPLLIMLAPERAYALEWRDLWQRPDQQASQLMEEEQFKEAAERFENPQWRAAAQYRAGDYEDSENGFASADTATAWYNRGNARAKSGDFEAAIKAYKEALKRQPDHEDALFNKQLLEQLQDQDQQQQENQEQQDQEQQNQEQEQQDQQDQQQEQQQGDQQQDEQQSDQQQSDQQQNEEQQSGEQNSEREQEQQEEEQAAPSEPEQQQADAEASTVEETEPGDEETERWLRQVPDDPGGLLRNKFRYESQQRQQQGQEDTRDDW